jgi:hypothetical protein
MSYEAIIAQLVLQGLQNLQVYQQLVLRARTENRQITEDEIDALGEIGKTIRAEARAEADRQRAESAAG